MVQFRPACRALLAVLALGAALLPQQVQAAPEVLRFQVVAPDGMPVVRPYVQVSVLPDGDALPHRQSVSVAAPLAELRGDAEGWVEVPAPVHDPLAARQIAAKLPVNLSISVFDKALGSADVNALYMNTGLNIGGAIPGQPFDLARAGDQVYTLQSGITRWLPVESSLLPGEAGGGGGGQPTPDPTPNPSPAPEALRWTDCGFEADARYLYTQVCHHIDYPGYLEHRQVPVAENYGAGQEMTATMSYQSTRQSMTTSAMQVGVSGFFETKGSVSYATQRTGRFGWAPVGHSVNKRATLDSYFLRDRTRTCSRTILLTLVCQEATIYRPAEAVGTAADTSWAQHDEFVYGVDCWRPVHGFYDKGVGVAREMEFSLSLGPGESWAETNQQSYGLRAQATVTSETKDSEDFVRSWSVDQPAASEFHYLFVPSGEVLRDPAKKGGGHCPEVDIEHAWTHATNQDLRDPPIATGTSEPERRAQDTWTWVDKCTRPGDPCGQEDTVDMAAAVLGDANDCMRPDDLCAP